MVSPLKFDWHWNDLLRMTPWKTVYGQNGSQETTMNQHSTRATPSLPSGLTCQPEPVEGRLSAGLTASFTTSGAHGTGAPPHMAYEMLFDAGPASWHARIHTTARWSGRKRYHSTLSTIGQFFPRIREFLLWRAAFVSGKIL